MSLSVGENGELARKASIMGALALYLDFINLFLLLLRILGRRRRESLSSLLAKTKFLETRS